MKENLLNDKSKDFALRIINLHRYLIGNKKEYVMSNQILRCGTSIGANIAESIYAQSKADFINKLSIAQKETNETIYWLDLLNKSGLIDDDAYTSINNDALELLKILTTSIKTLKYKPISDVCN